MWKSSDPLVPECSPRITVDNMQSSEQSKCVRQYELCGLFADAVPSGCVQADSTMLTLTERGKNVCNMIGPR